MTEMDPAGSDPMPEPSPVDITAMIEVIARVDPDKAARLVRVVQQFSGPLPPPEVLRRYDEVQPGLASRIVSMAEKEQTFRHGIVEKQINGVTRSTTRGQYLAFAVVVVMASAAGYVAHLGYPKTAGGIGGATLVALVSVFLGPRLLDRASDADEDEDDSEE
jgi:uncharacterized membrane protein